MALYGSGPVLNNYALIWWAELINEEMNEKNTSRASEGVPAAFAVRGNVIDEGEVLVESPGASSEVGFVVVLEAAAAASF